MVSNFWELRSKNYDQLFWVNNKEYIDKIIELGDFKQDDLVLDVGVGTGVMSKALEGKVDQIIGVDISTAMISKMYENSGWRIAVIRWDICDALFTNNLFDKILARMIFHHVTDDLDLAIKRCYDMLKPRGKIIIAEGIPPSEDDDVVDWYRDMFAYKEDRLTFSKLGLLDTIHRANFHWSLTYEFVTKGFSVKNWLINSGLDPEIQKKIMGIHKDAPDKIKDVYNMKITDDDCFIDTKNIIMVGEK